jgi:tripartite-type tricarboxylate transporter receptor subunit TctC
MTLSRRQFVQVAAGSLALPVMPGGAWAQDYPTRPVHLIVGLAPGSSPDIMARLTAQWFSQRLGQPFVVDNRPGAGGTIATGIVVRAPPDGYTLLQVSSSNAVSASFYNNLDYDFERDIIPVGAICASPNIMVVNPSFPARTIPEFIAYVKANPRKSNMASAGVGTETHAAGELFKMMAGIDMTHVPYRGGGPALVDLIAGQVQVMFPTSSACLGYIKSGTLRALGVSTSTRLKELPDIPTIAEFVPGFEASGWFGIGAPKNTPAPIINRLNEELNAALADPGIKSRLAGLGNEPSPGSAADFGKLITAETEKWAKVVKFAGLEQNLGGKAR